MKKDGITPAMPPNPMPHIVDRLMDMGLVVSNGMGATALGWEQLNAWERGTLVYLPTWEKRLIIKLSAEYLAENRRAENETCPPPWRAPVTKYEIDTEEARLRRLLG